MDARVVGGEGRVEHGLIGPCAAGGSQRRHVRVQGQQHHRHFMIDASH
jgi:hypothetical protein